MTEADITEDRTELVEVFRTFEAEIWRHINGQDGDEGRRAVAVWVAGELDRVRGQVDTELEIVS